MSSTLHSTSQQLVLQILPELTVGNLTVNQRTSQKIGSYIHIPNITNTIFCPLNYFQQSSSISQQWILHNSQKIQLNTIDNLKQVMFTVMKKGKEKIIPVSKNYCERLLEYFKLDICHETSTFIGFDCYAFVTFLANVEYKPQNPSFDFLSQKPKVGDFVILSNGSFELASIKHWALYLGNNYYISKFGMTTDTSDSLVEIMSLEDMQKLYDSKNVFVAVPKSNSQKWNGFLYQGK